MINVSLPVSESIFTKWRRQAGMWQLVEQGAFKEMREDGGKLKGTSSD